MCHGVAPIRLPRQGGERRVSPGRGAAPLTSVLVAQIVARSTLLSTFEGTSCRCPSAIRSASPTFARTCRNSVTRREPWDAGDIVQATADRSYQFRMDSGVMYGIHCAPAKSARWLTRYSEGRSPTTVWVSVTDGSLDETLSAPALMLNAVSTGGCCLTPWPDAKAGREERSPAMRNAEALRRMDGGIRIQET